MTATTTPARTSAPRRRRAGRSQRRQRIQRKALPYLLLLPALVLELLVHIVPMLIGIGMSLLKLTEFYIRNWSAAPSAGLSNYRLAIDFNQPVGSALLKSFWLTLEFTLIVVAASWLLGTAAAILMQNSFRGRGLLRTLFLVPYALPTYATVITWLFMFQRDNGLVNQLLGRDLHVVGAGSHAPFWLIGGNSFWALTITELWRTWPFAFLVLTAGLQNIPADLYEASALDGAGWPQQVRSVTLPMLAPVNQVLVLVMFLWTFNDFTTPYVLFGRSAPAQADMISMHIYQNSFITWNFGEGSAMSVLLLLFLLFVTAGYLLVTGRRRSHA